MTTKKLSVLEDLEGLTGVVKTEPKPKRSKQEAEKDVIFLKLDKAVVQQFRILAAELDMSQKDLGCEALNLVFARYAKPQIAK